MAALPEGPEYNRVPAETRCPTCRATLQDCSNTCRRCKCDLGLFQTVNLAYERSRHACQHALLAGDGAEALRYADRCRQLRPDAESRRLLALAALVSGDFPRALQLAGAANASRTS